MKEFMNWIGLQAIHHELDWALAHSIKMTNREYGL